MSEYQIRAYHSDDLPELLQLIRCAVLQLASREYTAEQCHAWTAHLNQSADPDVWHAHFARQFTRVVQSEDGTLAGFISLALRAQHCPTGTAWLDCLFNHPCHAGRGLASRLLTEALNYARLRACKGVETRASRCLAPVLKKQGWQTLFTEHIERHGQQLETRRMRLELNL